MVSIYGPRNAIFDYFLALNRRTQVWKHNSADEFGQMREEFFYLAKLHMEPTSLAPFLNSCSLVPTPNTTSILFNQPPIGAAAENRISLPCEAASASLSRRGV